MTTASHAVGPEFDSRSSYAYNAPLVQWLEFTVANGEARVRFSDGAVHKIIYLGQLSTKSSVYSQCTIGAVGSAQVS